MKKPGPGTLSRNVFENPYTFAKLRDGYAPRNELLGVLSPALITLVPTLIHAFAPGAGRHGGVALPWALVMLHAPLYLLSGHLLRQSQRWPFRVSYWVQSMVQFLWIQLLCWSTTPLFSIIGVTIFCTWAFNDARIFYDSRPTRAQYLLAFPVFDGALLLLDLAGRDGLLHRFHADPSGLKLFLAVQLVLALIAQIIVDFAGSESHAHDQRMVENASLERELAMMRTEREVLRQTNVYLGHGLAASKFSHDVASPVMVIGSNLGLLAELMAEAPHRDPKAREALAAMPPRDSQRFLKAATRWETETREICEEVSEASARVMTMTRALAEALKTTEAPVAQGVGELVARAVDEMHASLKGHDVVTPTPDVVLEECSVAVVPGHVGTLANLLTNGALQRPEEALVVRGRVLDEWFYHLSIRDQGVDAEGRDHALDKIRRSLSFEPPGAAVATGDAEAPRAYRGYGIALMMAKVLLVRHSGCVGVSGPADGRGVVFHVVLPRVAPREIPEAANQPEAALDACLT